MENKKTKTIYIVDRDKRTQLIRSTKLPPGAKLVYLCLVKYLGGKNYSWPSHETIATEVGLKPRQVGYHLKKLRQIGILRWSRGGVSPEGIKFSSNNYRLDWILTLRKIPVKKEVKNE